MITLKVNGKQHQLDIEPETPLLWVVRDELGLTGTKFGCGMALCGACTVHLNGQPVRSCQTPVSAVAGKRVSRGAGTAGRAGRRTVSGEGRAAGLPLPRPAPANRAGSIASASSGSVRGQRVFITL